MIDLPTVYRSGRVRRWHCNPDLVDSNQTLAQHQWGVAVIVLAEHPNPSKELLYAALLHDAGELIVGDLSAVFKKTQPKIAAAHKEAEQDAMDAMGITYDLTPQETAWLKWADRKEAYMWMMAHQPDLSRQDDWQDAARWLMGNKPS